MTASHRALCATLLLLTVTGPLGAQAPDGRSTTPDEQRAAFDYLLGDWEFTGERPGPNGTRRRFRGYWTATRTPANRTLVDEFRIVNDSGRTTYVTTTLRAYHPGENRWSLVSIESNGLFAEGKAWKTEEGMYIEQDFGSLQKFRYYNIRPDAFSWVGSGPDGKGGYSEFMWIEARRVGPHRPGVIAVRP